MTSILTAIGAWAKDNPWPTTILIIVVIGVLAWGTWFDQLGTLRAICASVGVCHG